PLHDALPILGPPVADSVYLEDVGRELLGDLRHIRRLEGTGGHHDLVCRDRRSIELEAEASVVAELEPLELAVQLDRQLEGLRVALEVGDHFIASRVPIRIAREREPRQRAVAAGREERECGPALAPCRGDLSCALDDDETAPLPGGEVADSETGLSGADYRNLVVLARMSARMA